MHRVQLCSIKANSVAACFIAALLNLRPLRLKLVDASRRGALVASGNATEGGWRALDVSVAGGGRW